MAFSSRLRTNIATLFDVFCEVGEFNEDKQPMIIQKYPDDYTDEAVLKSIRQFSFPLGDNTKGVDAVQLFSFVLTDENSQYTFGYCRFTPRNNTCICLLSGYPWTNVFYKLLDHISTVMNNGSQDDVDAILTRVYHTDTPNVGDKLHFESLGGKHRVSVEIPDPARLPSMREDRFMVEFYTRVNDKQLIAIYASLLKERRIIFTGRKLSQLSSCVHAAASLLYPMGWQSLFIPILPLHLKDMLMAPMPFLIGVPKQILDDHVIKELGEVVIVDLEEKTLQSAHDDVAELPSEVHSFLKNQIKVVDMSDSLSRVFLKANVILFGSYRLGLSRNEETSTVTWDKEKFLAEQRGSAHTFLSSLLGSDGVQYLERFIDERLKALNGGLPINDEFEKEIALMDNKIRTQVRDNASDVIGALKDKVQSIQIRDKLGRLTPKEIRRAKTVLDKKRSKTPNGTKEVEPLSFDNIQWSEQEAENQAADSSSSGDSSADTCGDLIQFGDSTDTTPCSELPPHRPAPIPPAHLNSAPFLPAQHRPAPAPPSSHPPSLPNDFSDLLSAPSRLAPAPPQQAPSLSFHHHQPPPVIYTNPFYNMKPTAATQNGSWERFE